MSTTRSELRRSVILQNLPRFLTCRDLRGSLQTYGQVQQIKLIHRLDHTYTNCCLLVMTTVAGVDAVLRDAPINIRGMKVMPRPYSYQLLQEVLILGQHEVLVDVPFEEGEEIKGDRFYEGLQVAFQDCNITHIKLEKEHRLYSGGASVFVKTITDRNKARRVASSLESGRLRVSRR